MILSINNGYVTFEYEGERVCLKVEEYNIFAEKHNLVKA